MKYVDENTSSLLYTAVLHSAPWLVSTLPILLAVKCTGAYGNCIVIYT